MRKRIRYRKILLVAAVVCALAALCITAYSGDFFGLRSLVIENGPQETALPDTNQDKHQNIQQQEEFISLQGFADSPESKAIAEWKDFVDKYDADGDIIASIGNGPTGVDAKYSLYNVYTQEMADKLQEIADRYGLKLHTKNEILTYEQLAEHLGGEFTDANNSRCSGYMYEDGSFSLDGDYFTPDGEIGYQLSRFVQGSFTEVYLNIGDVDGYSQWVYTTENGDRLLMALSGTKSLIITQCSNAFITMNVMSGYSSGITDSKLEEIADSVDWEILSSVTVPDFSEETAGEDRIYKSFDEVLNELQSLAKPKSEPMYSLYDADGDGVEELFVRSAWDSGDGPVDSFAVYCAGSTEIRRAEYLIYADDASLWENPDGGFYCVYQSVTYEYDLVDGQLSASVIRSDNTGVGYGTTPAPSEKPFLWSYAGDRELLSGDESRAFSKIQDFIMCSGTMTAREVYAAVLRNLMNLKVQPDGTEISGLLAPDADMSVDEFAVFDVDADGAEELIILQLQGSTAAHAGIVIGYDNEKGATNTQLWEYPMLTFYDNGVVTAGAGHNQGRGGDFWPYTLYVYDASSDTYVSVGSVDAWDKKLSDENPDVLPPFPTELDKSGSGFLYYIYAEGYDPEMLYDESVYLDWLKGYIDGAEKLELPFVSLTADNIRNMESGS